MTVHHQVAAVNQRIFETRPDLPPELGRDVQSGTEMSESDAGQVVHLRAYTYSHEMFSSCHSKPLNHEEEADLPEEQRQRALPQRTAARFGSGFGDG